MNQLESRRSAIAVLVIVVFLFLLFGYLMVGWERHPPEWQKSLAASFDRLTSAAYSSDGMYLAAGSATGQVALWNMKTGDHKTLQSLTEDPILTLKVSSDGFLAAGDAGGRVLGWQLGTDRTETSSQFPAAVTCLAFRTIPASGPEMVIGLANGKLVFFGTSGLTTVSSKHKGGVRRVAYSPDGRILVSGGTDGTICWYDAATRKRTATRTSHSAEIGALAFCENGETFASGDWNGDIVVWDAATHSAVAQQHQPDAVSAIAWSDNRWISASWDGYVRVYSSDLKTVQRQFDTGSVIHDLAISPDGSTLATVSDNASVTLWRVPTE